MNAAVAILGSGRMALNSGAYLLSRGARVWWICRTAQRARELEPAAAKLARRLERIEPGRRFEWAVRCAGDPDAETCDAVIECGRETVVEKQAWFERVGRLAGPRTLLCTASSSILPDRIRPGLVGLHLFYPVELTGFAEIVADGADGETRRRIVDLAGSCGLAYVVQDRHSAFAANRILLPLQAEAVRVVAEGADAETVDRCSVTGLTALGQLSLMDNAGLDTVAASVDNYLDMEGEADSPFYRPLREALARCLAEGRLGRKNGRGLLAGGPPQWARGTVPVDEAALRGRLSAVMLESCRDCVREGRAGAGDLRAILTRAFQADGSAVAAAGF